MPHSRMKKKGKGSKVDSASAATRKDTSPDTARTKGQESRKLPLPTPLSSPSKHKGPLVQLRRHKRSSRPSTRNPRKFETASQTNCSAKRIFSTPKPGSLG